MLVVVVLLDDDNAAAAAAAAAAADHGSCEKNLGCGGNGMSMTGIFIVLMLM